MPKQNQTKQSKRRYPGVLPQTDIVKNDREESVLMGHPEACGIYNMRRNVSDPYLEKTDVERMDYEYISPERQRLRSKYGDSF